MNSQLSPIHCRMWGSNVLAIVNLLAGSGVCNYIVKGLVELSMCIYHQFSVVSCFMQESDQSTLY